MIFDYQYWHQYFHNTTLTNAALYVAYWSNLCNYICLVWLRISNHCTIHCWQKKIHEPTFSYLNFWCVSILEATGGLTKIPVHFCNGAQGLSQWEPLLLTKHLLSTLYLPPSVFHIDPFPNPWHVCSPFLSALPSVLLLIVSLRFFLHSLLRRNARKDRME